MKSSSELTAYMNGAVMRLVANAIKSTLKNPKETAFFIEFQAAIQKANKMRLEREKEGIHIPAFLISSITDSCNLHCKGCYARENKICGESTGEPILSEKNWMAIFKEAQELGISFHLLAGGEPLMRREVILQAAKVNKVIFPIFTNGLMIDAEYLKLFSDHRNLIPVISIEGGREETDQRRGVGTYDRLIHNMKELQKMKVLYGASITVTSENIKEVTSYEYIKSLKDIGCRLVFFIEYVPVSKGTEYLTLSETDRAYLEEHQSMLRSKYEDVIFLSFPGDEQYMGGCLAAGRGFFHINPHGGAEPCPFSPYSDCNLKDHSLLEALQSPLFKKLNEMGLVGGDHKGGCALFEQEAEVRAIL